MQGSNEIVKAGQKFLFQCPARLSSYHIVSFTYDDTIRLKIQGLLRGVASNVAVSFESPRVPRDGYAVLQIGGNSLIDRGKGNDIRDNCLAAAQKAGLVVQASQSDIDIFPANARVAYNYSNLGGSPDPKGAPSPTTILLIGAVILVGVKLLRD